MTTTYNAASAAALGYPAFVLGSLPDTETYWMEPYLPFLDSPTLAHYQKSGKLPLEVLKVEGEGMAPRFPAGTQVAAAPIRGIRELIAGVYFWQWRDPERGVLLKGFGRLKMAYEKHLVLIQDRDGKESECPLLWKDEDFKLYLVDYYVSIPAR